MWSIWFSGYTIDHYLSKTSAPILWSKEQVFPSLLCAETIESYPDFVRQVVVRWLRKGYFMYGTERTMLGLIMIGDCNISERLLIHCWYFKILDNDIWVHVSSHSWNEFKHYLHDKILKSSSIDIFDVWSRYCFECQSEEENLCRTLICMKQPVRIEVMVIFFSTCLLYLTIRSQTMLAVCGHQGEKIQGHRGYTKLFCNFNANIL